MRTNRQTDKNKCISSYKRLVSFVPFHFFSTFRPVIIFCLAFILSPSLVSAYQISAGDNHTCALDDNGVICWGHNALGQNTVPELSNPTQISTGENHTCALDDNGVKCWGYNAFGQNTVPALSNPIQISAGGNHTCALDDTGIKCWGWNGYGQITVPALLSNPIQITAGSGHTCAIDDNGVVCWGWNGYGQITVPALSNPTQVSAGEGHTCALDDQGAVCWGWDAYGQSTVPALSNPTQISLGEGHTCALERDREVVCWGWNAYGQSAVPALSNPTQISLGEGNTCALDDQGVVCWGWDAFAQSTVDNSLSFSAINGSCGESHEKVFVSIPTENLCAAGLFSDVTGTNPWTWSCSGIYGGTDASCSTRTEQEENQIAFIERFYQNILNRPADSDGMEYWLNIIQNESATKVAFGFFNSQEFINLLLNDTDFAYILYQTLLDRQPDQGGLDYWVSQLEAGTLREMVIYAFVRSQEFTDLASSSGITAFNEKDNALFQTKSFVERFYLVVLDRAPDIIGFNYWSAQLTDPDSSLTAGDIARGFFQSSEFINRQTSDTEFIDIAYRAFFDREADEGGKQFWLDELSLGTSRLKVVNGFIGSLEFINLAGRYDIRIA